MKFSVQDGHWEIIPEKFLATFSRPGNAEHQLWAVLCRLSILRGEDPLTVTVGDLEAESGLEAAEIEKLLEASELHGFACRKIDGHNDE